MLADTAIVPSVLEQLSSWLFLRRIVRIEKCPDSFYLGIFDNDMAKLLTQSPTCRL